MILSNFIMYDKYQLIAISLLLCLALTISPIRNSHEQKAQSTTKSHPTATSPPKSQIDKSVKTPQLSKTSTSKTKNNKKQVTTTAQPKIAQAASNKVQTKSSTKSKQKQLATKQLHKQAQKSTDDSRQQLQSTKTEQKEKQKTTVAAIDKPEGHNFWVVFLIYLTIFCLLAYGARYVFFPQSNNAFQLILDIMIKIKEFSNSTKKRGYRAPEYHQEVDDSTSITVGYTEDHAKQLFWQKNSVEGI